MNTRAPLDDRWRTPLILTIGYAITSVGLAPAISIATVGFARGGFEFLMIAVGAGLLVWLWVNAGRQRRHDPTTWKPIVGGVAVTAMALLVIFGYLVVGPLGRGFS